MKQFIILLHIFCIVSMAFAQEIIQRKPINRVTGSATIGANVLPTGTTTQTPTNKQGNFIQQADTSVNTNTVSYGIYENSPVVHGRIYDAVTIEVIPSATITDRAGHAVTSDGGGNFQIATTAAILEVSSVGYRTQIVKVVNGVLLVALQPTSNQLEQVVVSANRTAEKRSESPVAISTISSQIIQETKAQRMDQVLNKVSGVYNASLGNELNQIAIRQPIGPNNRFLFLEDGLPLRTFAVFDHNGLVEINMAATKNIEVIKGPSSALYGAEAIGGAVNVITQTSPAYTSGYLSGNYGERLPPFRCKVYHSFWSVKAK